MKDDKSSESNITRRRLLGVSSAAMALLVALSCASARLDPERNQALTFDTVPAASDAGVLPGDTPSLPVKMTASQLAPDSPQGRPSSDDAGVRGEPLQCTVDPPDPKPSRTRDWLVYEFNYTEGAVSVRSQKRETTPKPRDSARVVGRYAVELWIGCELVDRVRFGFPLQAADRPKAESARHPLHEQPSLTQNAQLATTVRVPLDPRATRAELVDRGTGRRSALAWPPNLTDHKAPKTDKNPPNSPSAVPAPGSQSRQEPR